MNQRRGGDLLPLFIIDGTGNLIMIYWNTIHLFLILHLFSMIGCAGPLKVEYRPENLRETKQVKDHPVVLLKSYIDLREEVDACYIGRISATVTDINSDKLLLEKDAARLVTEAMGLHLTAAGFDVKEWTPELEASANAEFIISGEIKKFRLDIGARDEIEIELATKAVGKKTGKVVWEGAISEKEDRYAGVTGNSRKTIAAYISKTLRTAINRTIKEINAGIQEAKPSSAPDFPGARDTSIPDGFGRLTIKTDPPRSQVYLGDVYYGLTPLDLNMSPGVYNAVIRLKGFREIREKVSIRKRDVTEMELIMEKE